MTIATDAPSATDTLDWVVTDDAQLEALTPEPKGSLREPYRLYRLLADIDDILAATDDDRQRLAQIAPCVRHFLTNCDWLGAHYVPPDPKRGWSVSKLYDEPDYPLTVQLVAWSPGSVSKIHNHAAWGLVAMIEGEEKNTIWQRDPSPGYPGRLKKVSDRTFESGEIITFMPEAIHCVEALSDEPTVSFNLYGKTNYRKRYRYDVEAHTAALF